MNDDTNFYVVEIEPPQAIFYVHFDNRDLSIKSISAQVQNDDTISSIEIDYELGLKFMMGEENPISWAVGFADDKHQLGKISAKFHIGNRIDLLSSIVQVYKSDRYSDIVLAMDKDTINIHYDSEKLCAQSRPVKLYFTREDDPSHLKCTFSLDVNTLNAITQKNALDEWPNPIKLKLKDIEDTSVFMMKCSLTASIQ